MPKPMFSVSQFTTWHQTFEQDVRLYGDLGVEGVEICERKMSLDPAAARRQLEMVRDAGLTVTSVQPRVHALFQDFMCPDLTDPQQRMDRLRGTIDLFTDVLPDQDLVFVTIGGNAPNLNFQLAHRTARSLYPPLAEYAAARGARIAYEPLSPVLMNHDTFICTLGESMRLIEDVDRPAFGLMFDVYHLWREIDLAKRVAALGSRLFGLHLSDWPADEPRHPGDRRCCGEGIIDLSGILAAAERAGYQGACCLEIFSVDELTDSLWQADPADVIRRSRAGFEAAWESRLCA